ncbi:hypothetical protein EGR_11038 [Echinococcus granulosus]|uniref:Uncharacterized protein n=1 Tax=Echinococcus granulosus TaxID=6210 RepID=W6UKT3_ECHGR|nr:hypothetical protein EGR_11038 [Echinococcus granulosus]EUB54104.1 hypothetical protein EGR_11038 [Echinococcus granulosus]
MNQCQVKSSNYSQMFQLYPPVCCHSDHSARCTNNCCCITSQPNQKLACRINAITSRVTVGARTGCLEFANGSMGQKIVNIIFA